MQVSKKRLSGGEGREKQKSKRGVGVPVVCMSCEPAAGRRGSRRALFLELAQLLSTCSTPAFREDGARGNMSCSLLRSGTPLVRTPPMTAEMSESFVAPLLSLSPSLLGTLECTRDANH